MSGFLERREKKGGGGNVKVLEDLEGYQRKWAGKSLGKMEKLGRSEHRNAVGVDPEMSMCVTRDWAAGGYEQCRERGLSRQITLIVGIVEPKSFPNACRYANPVNHVSHHDPAQPTGSTQDSPSRDCASAFPALPFAFSG